MEVVSVHLSQCNQLPYIEVKVVVHCKDSAKSCNRLYNISMVLLVLSLDPPEKQTEGLVLSDILVMWSGAVSVKNECHLTSETQVL